MSTMQAGFGRVVDERIDGAAMVGALARRARKFLWMMNGMPSVDEAEAVFWRQKAADDAEKTRIDTLVRFGHLS